MYELLHRFAIAVLLAGGALTAGVYPEIWLPAGSAAAGLLAHRHFMLVLLGTSLMVAAVLPSWRLPVVAAAVMSKADFLLVWRSVPHLAISPGPAVLEATLLLLLLGAAAIFAREAWQDARWHGMLPLRPEA